jgi:hypothetical protein
MMSAAAAQPAAELSAAAAQPADHSPMLSSWPEVSDCYVLQLCAAAAAAGP